VSDQPDPGRSWRLGLVLAVTIFTGTLGVLFRNPQLTALAEALACTVGLSWLAARVALAGLRVRRSAPDQASEDEWLPVRLQLRNEGKLNALRVEVRDRFTADPLFERADLVASLGPGETQGLLFERPCSRGRGVFGLGPVELAVSDPLGLFRLTRSEPLSEHVVVYPRPLSLRSLGLESALEKAFRGDGSRPRPGQGIQLFGLRELRSGERAQRIHWRASARLSRLVVTEREAPSRSEVTVFLDMSLASLRGVGRGSNVETAIRLAAGVTHFALDRGHACGLVADDGEVRVILPRHGRRQRVVILDALARLQVKGETDYLDLLAKSSAHVSGGGCVVLVLNRLTLESERFTAVWAGWQQRNVSAIAFVVDDTKLMAHEWAQPETGEDAPLLLGRLGIPCVTVTNARDLEDAAL
jgi:uncharacterized protein (DUF58 family)